MRTRKPVRIKWFKRLGQKRRRRRMPKAPIMPPPPVCSSHGPCDKEHGGCSRCDREYLITTYIIGTFFGILIIGWICFVAYLTWRG